MATGSWGRSKCQSWTAPLQGGVGGCPETTSAGRLCYGRLRASPAALSGSRRVDTPAAIAAALLSAVLIRADETLYLNARPLLVVANACCGKGAAMSANRLPFDAEPVGAVDLLARTTMADFHDLADEAS